MCTQDYRAPKVEDVELGLFLLLEHKLLILSAICLHLYHWLHWLLSALIYCWSSSMSFFPNHPSLNRKDVKAKKFYKTVHQIMSTYTWKKLLTKIKIKGRNWAACPTCNFANFAVVFCFVSDSLSILCPHALWPSEQIKYLAKIGDCQELFARNCSLLHTCTWTSPVVSLCRCVMLHMIGSMQTTC